MNSGRPVKVQTAAPERIVPVDSDAAALGQKVLVGLTKGRQLAIQRSRKVGADNAYKVVILANLDMNAGSPQRGRAGRIARNLGGLLTERSVKRILDRLSSVSDSSRHTGQNTGGLANEK